MKKCVECRSVIESSFPITDLFVVEPGI